MAKRAVAADSLSREAVVDRALEIADAEGLEAVTIRRLGVEFGVTPMALYWHVKNKDELLEAMGDRILALITLDDLDASAPWHEQLGAIIHKLVNALRPHPTCTMLAARRIVASEAGIEVSERAFAVLREAGFSVRDTASIATQALQTAMMLITAEPGAEPGVTPEERERRLAEKRRNIERLPADRYPRVREMVDALLDCDDLQEYYDYGIAVFVAGARTLLAAG